MSASNSSVPLPNEEGPEDVEMLSEIIPPKPPQDSKLKYNGWILGRPTDETIVIRVEPSAQVDDMSTAIYEKTGGKYPQDDLIIWKVSTITPPPPFFFLIIYSLKGFHSIRRPESEVGSCSKTK
jgi:hypothetical protein